MYANWNCISFCLPANLCIRMELNGKLKEINSIFMGFKRSTWSVSQIRKRKLNIFWGELVAQLHWGFSVQIFYCSKWDLFHFVFCCALSLNNWNNKLLLNPMICSKWKFPFKIHITQFGHSSFVHISIYFMNNNKMCSFFLSSCWNWATIRNHIAAVEQLSVWMQGGFIW